MLELNESNYDAEIATELPVVIDFYTTWCGPCRALAPMFKRWAEAHSDKAKFAKVDIEQSGGLSIKFNVSHIPTVVVLDGGKEVKRWVGIPPEDQLVEEISK